MAEHDPLRRRGPAASAARRPAEPAPALGVPGDLDAQQAAVGNLEMGRRLVGLQTKLRVSEPGDAHEREADRVADAVMAMPDVQRQVEPTEEEEPVAASRQAEPTEEEEPVAASRQAEPTEEEEPVNASRQAEPTEEEEMVATKGPGGAAMTGVAESAVNRTRGAGHPLDSGTRRFFEPRLGHDLSAVKVHTDPSAARLARDLSAQAFTVGHDVYFAEGRYQPGAETGRTLLAHELTHTIQQQPGAKLAGNSQGPRAPAPARAARQVQRQGAAPAAPGAPAATGNTPIFYLPQVKARHLQLYQAWAGRRALMRNKGYSRDTSPEDSPDQMTAVWFPSVIPALDSQLLTRLDLNESFTGEKTVKDPSGANRTGTRTTLLQKIAVPDWNRAHARQNFQVDHIVELQAAGWPGGAGNAIDNMELLQSGANASSGGKTQGNIVKAISEHLAAQGLPSTFSDAVAYKAANDVVFNEARLGTGEYAGTMRENRNQWWTRDEIVHGDHMAGAEVVGNVGEIGGPTSFALFSPLSTSPEGEQVGGRALMATLPHSPATLLTFNPTGRHRTAVAGLTLQQVALQAGYTAAGDNAAIGSVQARWALPPQFGAPADTFALPLHKMPGNQYGGYLGAIPVPALSFPTLSAVQFDSMSADGGGLAAVGRLTPSLPLLGAVPIEVRLRGGDIEFAYTFSAGEIALPMPGLRIDDATVSVFYSTAGGFGAEGSIYLSVAGLGTGDLTARATTQGGLDIEGGFNFDSRLFDEAAIRLWYREGAFGGSGRLAINSPDKVAGIRSAAVDVAFSAEAFSATGTVAPSIPGVEEAALTVSYSEAEGLAIGGTLALASTVPGIESGSVEATVRKVSEEEGWKLSASGRARPKVPGLDSEVAVSYDDGMFVAEVTAAYERGMLAGSLRFGVTNRPIDDAGNPGEGTTPELRAFGGGSLTLTLAPWLAATAAVRLTPEGEVEVTGRIGLPAALEVFPARRFDRNLFSINIDIPIVGVSVAGQRIGIFATIGGGLDLSAGFGPGQLRDLHLEVTYNPDHEDQTLVSGAAEFFVPADAGLRLFVRGSLGAGIPIVSASAGIEVGGQLGIEGAVRAGVEVSWTPTAGLDLTAEAEIFAEPKFRFDVTGFVLVEADLLFTTVELYSQRWRLAEFEYGSGLRIGARFPIHYQEGQPFDLSLDDIQFEYPDIDPMALLSGLIEQLA